MGSKSVPLLRAYNKQDQGRQVWRQMCKKGLERGLVTVEPAGTGRPRDSHGEVPKHTAGLDGVCIRIAWRHH